jgi:hypothetical protein
MGCRLPSDQRQMTTGIRLRRTSLALVFTPEFFGVGVMWLRKQPRVTSRSLAASTNSLSQPSWDQLGLTAAMVGVGWPLQRNR